MASDTRKCTRSAENKAKRSADDASYPCVSSPDVGILPIWTSTPTEP